MRRLRYRFWRFLGGGLARMYRFCRCRQALNCDCFGCYVALNHDRIVREALQDAEREVKEQRPVDRRPS